MKSYEQYKIRFALIDAPDEKLNVDDEYCDVVAMWIDDPRNEKLVNRISFFYTKWEKYLNDIDLNELFNKNRKHDLERLIYQAFFLYDTQYMYRKNFNKEIKYTEDRHETITKELTFLKELINKTPSITNKKSAELNKMVTKIKAIYPNEHLDDEGYLKLLDLILNTSPFFLKEWSKYYYREYAKSSLNEYQQELVRDFSRILFSLQRKAPKVPKEGDIQESNDKPINGKYSDSNLRYKFLCGALEVIGFKVRAKIPRNLRNAFNTLNWDVVKEVEKELNRKGIKKPIPKDLLLIYDDALAKNIYVRCEDMEEACISSDFL